MFYVIAIVPALVILVLLVGWAMSAGKHYWVFGFAAFGCLISAATPWFSMWYVWNVLNDHTANIGFGMLAIGQPLIAPLGAALGACVGMLVEAAVVRKVYLTSERHGGGEIAARICETDRS